MDDHNRDTCDGIRELTQAIATPEWIDKLFATLPPDVQARALAVLARRKQPESK